MYCLVGFIYVAIHIISLSFKSKYSKDIIPAQYCLSFTKALNCSITNFLRINIVKFSYQNRRLSTKCSLQIKCYCQYCPYSCCDFLQVRWGDKEGGYGEHYWDLNHAGHAGNNDNDEDDSYRSDKPSYGSPYHSDDDSYRVHDTSNEDTYDEPSEQSPKYTEYNSDNAENLEETNRAKRAHPRIKTDKQQTEENPRKPQRFRKIKEPTIAASNVEAVKTIASNGEHVETNNKRLNKRSKLRQTKPQKDEYQDFDQDDLKAKSSNTQVQTLNPNFQTQSSQYTNIQRPVDQTQYVPYESGAGVRQYQSPELTEAATVPRLFLEAATGHVVDRATGQAYVLQPVAVNNNYN